MGKERMTAGAQSPSPRWTLASDYPSPAWRIAWAPA